MGVFDDASKSAENFKNDAAEAFGFLKDAFASVVASIQDGFDELNDSIDNTGDNIDKKIKKSIQRDVVSSIKKFNQSLSEGVRLNSKLATGALKRSDILKAQTNLLTKEIELEALLASAKAQGVELDEETINGLRTQIDFTREEIELVEKLNKEKQQALGITGQGLSTVDGLLRKIGARGLADSLDFQGAIDAATTINRKGEAGKRVSIDWSKATGNIFKNLKGAVNPTDLLVAGLYKLFEASKKLDKNVANLRRNFGISTSEAVKLNNQFAKSAIKSGDITANVESLTEANQGINDNLGIQVRYNDELLVRANKLVKRNKQSMESMAGFADLVLASGTSAEDLYDAQSRVVAEVQNSTKVALNFNKVLEEANKTTGMLRVNLGRTPEEIAKAVAQVKALGIGLAEAASISGKLLDFQSSIEAELKAEALTGKQLNLERARGLALQGKADEAAKEVLKQVGSLAEFQKLNVVQQQALADAAGLTGDQLADQILKQEAINSQKQEGLNIDSEQQKAGAEAMSVQEKLASAVEKLNSILQMTGIIIGGIIGAVTGFFLGGPVGALIGLIGGAGLIGGIQAVSDGVAPSSKGPFTITDSYGATAVTAAGDNVVVSPNVNQGGGSGITSAQANEMISLLRQVASKDFSINMDGRKLNDSMKTSGVSYSS